LLWIFSWNSFRKETADPSRAAADIDEPRLLFLLPLWKKYWSPARTDSSAGTLSKAALVSPGRYDN